MLCATLQALSNYKAMVRNYIIIAWRNLWKHKLSSLINIIGLGLSIACCILIALFVREEWTFDKFHTKADNIYRAFVKEDYGENEQFFNTVTPFPLGPVLKENFSEILAEVRITPSNTIVKSGDEQFSEQVLIVGKSFFRMFDFESIAGDGNEALNQQQGVIISEKTARKYFGDQNPLHKPLSIQIGQEFEEFEVQAIVKNPPGNSSIQFDFLISELNLSKFFPENLITSAWLSVTPETYLLLRNGVTSQQVEAKFPPLFETLLGQNQYNHSKYYVGLQPLTAIHLDNEFPVGLAMVSNPKYSYILSGVALLILIIASINFITLAVARSVRRTKEVGIRKMMGAARTQLIGQFIGESVIVSCIATLVGLILAVINISLFNQMAGKELIIDFNFFTALLLACLVVLMGVFAGSYPAYIMSLFKPVDIIKGGKQGDTKQNIRKTLVGLQIVISAFLITTTLLMRQQLQYLQNKDLGFEKEQLVVIPMDITGEGSMLEIIKRGFEKARQMEIQLAALPGVISSGATSHDFGNGNWTNIGYTDEQGSYRTFNLNIIDENYLQTLKIDLTAGRNFSPQFPADKNTGIIINQAFADAYGWLKPLGERIPGANFGKHEVIGVVQDFNYAALYSSVEPLVMVMNPDIIMSGMENIEVSSSPLAKLILRLSSESKMESINQVKEKWNKIIGQGSFSFSFVDETLIAQYRADLNLNRIINISTWLAIIIGSLGLYALTSLAMQNRSKEMGLRRVLGATQSALLLLISKEYLYLVLLSFIISVPPTWYLIREWLSNFEYRITLGPGQFVLSGLLALTIALCTIGYQALKNTHANPVDTLRNE